MSEAPGAQTLPAARARKTARKGERVVLRDGSAIRVRQLRAEDRDLLRAGFEHLSDESRYRRFLVPMPRLGSSMLDYLVSVDHVDHEALAAVSERGEPVGVVRYVRADAPDAAEVAATVVDAWQGRGVATELLLRLAERARANGIARFTAFVLPANEEIVEVLRGIGEVTLEGSEGGVLALEVDLHRPELHRPLRRLLRAAASGEVRT